MNLENSAPSSENEKTGQELLVLLQNAEKRELEAQKKVELYEHILNGIVHPITVADIERNVIFENKAAIEIKNTIPETRSEQGTRRFTPGAIISSIPQNGKYYAVDCSVLKNAADQTAGYVEVMSDITKIQHHNEVLQESLNQIAQNIEKLAHGELNLKYSTSHVDGEFKDTGMMVSRINENLKAAVDAINLMMEDVMMLSEAAINGVLDTRVDISRHTGDYTLVIQGINEILDAILVPVEEGIRVCDEYANSNFSASFTGDIALSGDFLKFSESLNTIGEKISAVIRNLKSEVVTLSHHAENAMAGVDDVGRGAQGIAESANDTSKNAENAEEGIEHVLQAMTDLTTVVNEISGDADTLSQLSNKTREIALKGTETAGSAERGMHSITASSSEVERNITEIRDEMNKIRKIVNIITDLANQTNLLALNAAIEAARAGEAGRGFAVVAAEVKSLAQESRASAESITEMIMGLEHKSDSAASAIDAAGKAVTEGNAALTQTLAIFHELTESVVRIHEGMAKIAKSTDHQAASFEEISANAHDMSSLVKKTADDAIHSSATAEEAMALVNQITDIISNINKAVDSMGNEMNSFRVR